MALHLRDWAANHLPCNVITSRPSSKSTSSQRFMSCERGLVKKGCWQGNLVKGHCQQISEGCTFGV